mmetsp:Transcript_11909/g.21558  ORF Transcript_11909/g.21558 Transcript_11909/m.21558 type:complete len:512 (-) Transcript_11909:266-1801(-)
MVDELLGLFFAEFDSSKGLIVSCQAPENALSSQDKDILSPVLIPHSQLYGRTLSHSLLNSRLALAVTTHMEGPQYPRNGLLFNVGIVLFTETPSYSAPLLDKYAPLAHRLSKILSTMESETCFISNTSASKILPQILHQILSGLHKHSKCSVHLDAANVLHFARDRNPRLLQSYNISVSPSSCQNHSIFNSSKTKFTANQIQFSDVPVPLYNPAQMRDYISSHSKWMIQYTDLAIDCVICAMDGVQCIYSISETMSIDIEMVCSVVYSLLEFQLILIVDLFQYSNKYRLSASQFSSWLSCEMCRNSATHFVTQSTHLAHNTTPPVDSTAQNRIIKLYSILKPDQSIREMIRNEQSSNLSFSLTQNKDEVLWSPDDVIDPRRWILYGTATGIILRIRTFILWKGIDQSEEIQHQKQQIHEQNETVTSASTHHKQGHTRAVSFAHFGGFQDLKTTRFSHKPTRTVGGDRFELHELKLMDGTRSLEELALCLKRKPGDILRIAETHADCSIYSF